VALLHLIVQSILNDHTKRSSIGLASTFIFEFSDAPFITFQFPFFY